MKSIYSKLAVGFFALVCGIWIGDGFQPLTSVSDKSQNPVVEEISPLPTPIADMNGKIQLRFKKFEQRKDLYAEFEIFNGMNHGITYAGYKYYSKNSQNDENNFCNLATEQNDKWGFVETGDCGGALIKVSQGIASGGHAIFSVAKWDVKKSLNLSASQPAIKARIGFEIYVGEDQKKQIIWTDEITFPETLD